MFKHRYRRILRFFWRVILSELWWDVILPKVGFRWLSRRARSKRLRKIAAAFRALAIRMGGVLIKVGQFLSARLDVLPREITSELSGLQDEVGAERFDDIRGVIESEFGMPLDRKFADFSLVPVASASIGQVHCARLCQSSAEGKPDPPVVVKVQRPHIKEIVDADLAAIRVAGGWLSRFKSVKRHVNVHALIEEFSRSLYEEIDYLHEGKNAERFAENFKDRPEVRVPDVVWSHTSRRVLTLQDVGAIKITDYSAIEEAGIDRTEVADRLLQIYLQQVFEDGFFHADPHPGNLFVMLAPTKESPGAFRLVFVDFGMTGALSPNTFAGLREVLISVGTQDAARLVGAFQKLNILLPGADLELIERASRKVFERVWGKSTKDIMEMSREDVTEFFEEFGDLLYEMPFQVSENLILLGRCVSILSGMATGLDPDFNIWNGLAPYAQKLVEADGKSGIRLILHKIAVFARALAELPKRVDTLVTRMEQGKLEVRVPEMKQQVARLEHSVRKLSGSIILSTVLLIGSQFYLRGNMELSIVCGALGGGLLLWILFGR